MRDEFPEPTKRILAQRVANRCSNPECQAPTSGPQVCGSRAISIGVAAHITAAARGGPRYNERLTSEQRRSADNGIWLCQSCNKLVDSDSEHFSETLLRLWKRTAETTAFAALGKTIDSKRGQTFTAEEIELLSQVTDRGEIWLLESEQARWVRAGTTNLQDDTNATYAAAYVDALATLVQKRLARKSDGRLFSLTSDGFRIVRRIRELGNTPSFGPSSEHTKLDEILPHKGKVISVVVIGKKLGEPGYFSDWPLYKCRHECELRACTNHVVRLHDISAARNVSEPMENVSPGWDEEKDRFQLIVQQARR